MAPPDVMLGAWKLIRQENFDEYLFTLGTLFFETLPCLRVP
jgi:hypothetical protein